MVQWGWAGMKDDVSDARYILRLHGLGRDSYARVVAVVVMIGLVM